MTHNINSKDIPQQKIDLDLLDKSYKTFPTFSEWTISTSTNQSLWERKLETVKKLKELDPSVLTRARDVATRAAAIDTGAIEGLYEVDRGFTYTVAVESGAWEAVINSKGKEFKVMFEAQLRAYEYILDWATSNQPITEVLIRTLHQEICKEQDTYTVQTVIGPQEQTLPKGIYKTTPNHVLQKDGHTHSYCPVEQTAIEMERFVNELRSSEFLNASAPQQAAYCHYVFVVVHPFSDGNGRVARALASVYTYRELCAPLLVLLDDRSDYFDALSQADNGDYQPMVSFIFKRVCNSIDLVEESVRTAQASSLKDSIRLLKKVYYTPSGFTHQQIDQSAIEISNQLLAEISKLSESNSDKHWVVKVEILRLSSSQIDEIENFRDLLTDAQAGLFVDVKASSEKPQKTSSRLIYRVLMPKIAGEGEHILIKLLPSKQGGQLTDWLEIPLDACIPKISTSTEWKIRMLAERALAGVLSGLIVEQLS